MPTRIQRTRRRGWRMPPAVVYVGRPTKWGNPFFWHVPPRAEPRLGIRVGPAIAWLNRPYAGDVVHYYRQWILGALPELKGMIALTDRAADLRLLLDELRGFDLCCWCPLDRPCHADVLLELANNRPKLEGIR